MIVQSTDLIGIINYHTASDRHIIFLKHIKVFGRLVRSKALFDLDRIQVSIFDKQYIYFLFINIPVVIEVVE